MDAVWCGGKSERTGVSHWLCCAQVAQASFCLSCYISEWLRTEILFQGVQNWISSSTSYVHKGYSFIHSRWSSTKLFKMFQPFKILNNWGEMSAQRSKAIQLLANFWFGVKDIFNYLIIQEILHFRVFFISAQNKNCFSRSNNLSYNVHGKNITVNCLILE